MLLELVSVTHQETEYHSINLINGVNNLIVYTNNDQSGESARIQNQPSTSIGETSEAYGCLTMQLHHGVFFYHHTH